MLLEVCHQLLLKKQKDIYASALNKELNFSFKMNINYFNNLSTNLTIFAFTKSKENLFWTRIDHLS